MKFDLASALCGFYTGALATGLVVFFCLGSYFGEEYDRGRVEGAQLMWGLHIAPKDSAEALSDTLDRGKVYLALRGDRVAGWTSGTNRFLLCRYTRKVRNEADSAITAGPAGVGTWCACRQR